jgi:NAD(P)-dependent dehydrogenase (short-subunit alcohol dehydrogenase family)
VTVMEETLRPGGGWVDGKVAVVTGAGQMDGPGIGNGKATCLLLARHGASLVLVDRERERAEITKKEIEQAGGRAIVVEGDVTSIGDAERFTRAATDEYGRLDILVNNVGAAIPASVVDMTEETWATMIDVNLKSVFLVSKFAIPAMVEGGGGAIVNVSSIAAVRSIGFAGYSAAKAGMIGLTREIAVQHGPQGIRCNVVVLGTMQTPRYRYSTALAGKDAQETIRLSSAVLPLGRRTRGTGYDTAYAVLFFASDASSWITGQALSIDGGSTAMMPENAVGLVESIRRETQS